MDPFDLLLTHADLTLLTTRLPDGEMGRWYPDLSVIVLSDRLSRTERRTTLLHELVHRMRGDSHDPDDLQRGKQERSCDDTVARLLIPFERLRAAMQWGRDPEELAAELDVDVPTLRNRVAGLSQCETALLVEDGSEERTA